ncbi:MAG: NAD(P)-binding domain-containing protein, partial [Candidatus Latescibacterota bacterium]|nr:NAD(P)-binding domain-containing protein [Candidatus Latescibacterota bacterium]
MRLGMIGLGRMGANMTTRLLAAGHQIVVYDRDDEAVKTAQAGGAEGASTLQQVVDALPAPRVVWVMVPSGDPTEESVMSLAEL